MNDSVAELRHALDRVGSVVALTGAGVSAESGVSTFTSAVVYPATGLAQVARESGAKLAIVNPEPTPLDHTADWVLRGPSGEILPRLL